MLLSLFHAIVAIVVYATTMPLAARLAVILLVFLSLLYYLARDALLLLPDSWCDIALNQDSVSVVPRNSSGFSGQVASKTIVSPHFIVLRIKPDNYFLPVSRVIFPDALGTDAFRDLCVHLKFA